MYVAYICYVHTYILHMNFFSSIENSVFLADVTGFDSKQTFSNKNNDDIHTYACTHIHVYILMYIRIIILHRSGLY